MMFLAPSPFVAVLTRSEAMTVATQKLRALLARSVHAEQVGAVRADIVQSAMRALYV